MIEYKPYIEMLLLIIPIPFIIYLIHIIFKENKEKNDNSTSSNHGDGSRANPHNYHSCNFSGEGDSGL
ncbi:hypothetical protein [Arcobacter sp. LA11]|uniref:hypothetical protein n=1 Tax=Arcobacter sp. LA11 TaxID=1898176 RepID=UPI000934C2A1|nr:hypothetical protein [Arcobacter sp. LA11]